MKINFKYLIKKKKIYCNRLTERW